MSIWDPSVEFVRDTDEPIGRGGVSVPPTHPAPGSGSGLDLSFFASLGVSLGHLADAMTRDQDRKDRLSAALVPQDHQTNRSGTVGASGKLLLDLGSVPVGRVWQVRRIVVGGVTATATPTGSAFVIAQGSPPDLSNLPTSNVVDSFPSFSNGAHGSTYGTHNLFLVAPEHLFVAIVGATTGVQWTASIRVEDFDADTYYEAQGGLNE